MKDMEETTFLRTGEQEESDVMTFLGLPAELRLQIYSYLLFPQATSPSMLHVPTSNKLLTSQDLSLSQVLSPSINHNHIPPSQQSAHFHLHNHLRISSRTGSIIDSPKSKRSHLTLSQTCRQINDEILDLFYGRTLFTITLDPLNAFGASSTLCRKLLLPEHQLHVDRIRVARLLISLDGIEGGAYIDLQGMLAKMRSLQCLSLAFAFPRRAYMREENADLWSKSATLQGMICHAVQFTPRSVALTWYSDSRETMMTEEWDDDFWRFVCVPASVLEEMARAFEPLRGVLASRSRLGYGEIDRRDTSS